ncbi:C4-dicarboxylic acid transporter DauA [Zooshikella sp. RANM57]|uniref:C4-dicarboxylic acid transporter DauA n=1 Tax=Zooshikella sp. RANM57 TaxID=3425863 RepID=UPI003D6E5263
MFSALTRSFKNERSWGSIQSNLIAGLTVGVIALPLSMALAIAIGVPPQHGLYTAIVAGIITSLTGGSKVNISGPTAAFVVVLLPIVHSYGLGGLLVSGFMAGIILVLMGSTKLGRLIEIVPYPVTVGFTAGIGVVIATLQIKDFLGLQLDSLEGHYLHKLAQIGQALPSVHWQEALIGGITLAVLIVWPKLKSKIPGHLVALFVGAISAWLLSQFTAAFSVETVGTRFHYVIDGQMGFGIPPILPAFNWPWHLPAADGQPIGISFDLVHELLSAAFTIAVLGALESLLCAVVADGMSGKKHNPNDELIGQGIGNMIAPLFGGIPATAAIARTTANVKAGGSSPLASVVHGLFILVSILSLAPLLAYIPMASMAALLLMVAWNMSEARHFIRIVRIAPRDDIITLLTCFALTVLFDMTIAVAVGMCLAVMFFVRKSMRTAEAKPLLFEHDHIENLTKEISIYDINGPLFFGSAQKALNNLMYITPEVKVVILDMTEVSMIDMSAIVAMESIAKNLSDHQVGLIINNLQPRMILKLRRAGIRTKEGRVAFSRKIEDAVEKAKGMLLHTNT